MHTVIFWDNGNGNANVIIKSNKVKRDEESRRVMLEMHGNIYILPNGNKEWEIKMSKKEYIY